MFRMYASNSHSYTHLILALGIVREPMVWVCITSKYPGIHDIGLPTYIHILILTSVAGTLEAEASRRRELVRRSGSSYMAV